MQEAIVAVLVAMAGALLAAKVWLAIRRRNRKGQQGCGKCGKCG